MAITQAGFLSDVAERLDFFGNWPVWATLFLMVCLSVIATEFGSNTAIVTLLIPTTLSIGPLLGIDVYALALAVTLAGSLSFMMPMATPPNAAVFAKGHVRMGDMMRLGFALNLVFSLLITLVALLVNALLNP